MPRRRMNARTIREILRLKSLNLSTRQISRSVKKAKSSIQRLVRRAEQVGLRWPLDVDDRKLEEMLYAGPEVWREGKPLPDWSYIHGQLKRKGVTRQLLWKEYADMLTLTIITARRGSASSTALGARRTQSPR